MKSFRVLVVFILVDFVYFHAIFHFAECLGDDGLDDMLPRPPHLNAFPPPSKQQLHLRRLAEHDDDPSDLSVATYNIWNIMFHWEVRKIHIADMVSF